MKFDDLAVGKRIKKSDGTFWDVVHVNKKIREVLIGRGSVASHRILTEKDFDEQGFEIAPVVKRR